MFPNHARMGLSTSPARVAARRATRIGVRLLAFAPLLLASARDARALTPDRTGRGRTKTRT
jgi:hypothetical protein